MSNHVTLNVEEFVDGSADGDIALGIHGNGQMMKSEKNSDDGAKVILVWIKRNVVPMEAEFRATAR